MRFHEKLGRPGFGWYDLWPYLPSADLRSTTSVDFRPDNLNPGKLWSIYLESERFGYLREPRMNRFWLLFSDYQIAGLGARAGQINFEKFQQLYSRFYQDVTRHSPVGPRGLADLGIMWSALIQQQARARTLSQNPLEWQSLQNEAQNLTLAAIRRIPRSLTRAGYLSTFATVFPETNFDPDIEKIIRRSGRSLIVQHDISDAINSLSRLSSHFSSAEVPLNQLLSRPDVAQFHLETVRSLLNHLATNRTLPEWQRIQFMMQVNGTLARLPHGDHRDRLLESMVKYYSEHHNFDRALELWRQIDQEVYLNFAVSELVPLALEQGRIEELRHEFEKTYVPKLVQDRFAYRYSSSPAPPANSVEIDEIAQDATHWWGLQWYLALRFMPQDVDWLSLPEVRCFVLDQRNNNFGFEELLDHQARHPHPWLDRLIYRRFEKSAQNYQPDRNFYDAGNLAEELLLWSSRPTK